MRSFGKPAHRVFLAIATILGIAMAGYSVNRFQSEDRAVSVEFVAEHLVDPPTGSVLRLGTYNIAHGRGGVLGASKWDGGNASEKQGRLEKIGQLLAKLELDIVVLNEVDFSCPWSHHLDQASIIAAAGRYPYIARQRNLDIWFPFAQIRFGNAVLSRYPITSAKLMQFEPFSKTETLLAGNHDSVLTQIALPNGKQLGIWAAHLEVRSREIRLEAARRMQEISKQLEMPLLVVGDLNSILPPMPDRDKGATAISLLLSEGRFEVFPKAGDNADHFTFPSEAPSRTIDWILYPPTWRLAAGGVAQAPMSDHLPVFVSLEWD